MTRNVAHVNSKICRTIFAIQQSKFTVPLSILKTHYFALIQPHLSYGILAWGNAGSKILHITIQFQKYAPVPSTKLHTIATPTLYLANHKLYNSLICMNMNQFVLCVTVSKIIYLNLLMMFFAIIVMCKISTEPANQT